MPDSTASNAVNQHYLSKGIDLSENMRVEATEDILDARGNKLLAKGAQLSRAMQERLIAHKLKKPLEACIVVEGGVDGNAVKLAAERIIDTSAALSHILARTQTETMSPVALQGTQSEDRLQLAPLINLLDDGQQAQQALQTREMENGRAAAPLMAA